MVPYPVQISPRGDMIRGAIVPIEEVPVRTLRSLLTVLALVLAVGGLTAGCGGEAATISVGQDTQVIDVRTPAEYAEGHLEGAVNIDVTAGDFGTQIAVLPADGDYVVYCRSGNRSAQAAAQMEDAGFTHVTDAGGLDDAADATGLAIVQGG